MTVLHADRWHATLQELYYKNDQDIASDGELQNWWDEIKCAASTAHMFAFRTSIILHARVSVYAADQPTAAPKVQPHLAHCIAGAILGC